MSVQVLREWPPGFGGVERVAHELAVSWTAKGAKSTVFSLGGVMDQHGAEDPLNVPYERVLLPRLRLGKLILPLPSRSLWRLLSTHESLHAHLPCPGVLMVIVLARLVRPRRHLSVHWHAFLEGRVHRIYQRLALIVVRWLPLVVTTSPPLATGLVRRGCCPGRVQVLPCCLDETGEVKSLAIPDRLPQLPFQVLFIGRLDSYKRVDWLIKALAALPQTWQLDVVGTGPKQTQFEELAQGLPVKFWGRLEEKVKRQRLAAASLLVLPSDSCNEAFGIVQLEAMASGIPSLSFVRPDSGMAWVCSLAGLEQPITSKDLATVLTKLASDPIKLAELGQMARQRYNHLFSRDNWIKRFDSIFPIYT